MENIIELNAPQQTNEVRLLQLPEYGMGWLHFFDSKGKENVKGQIFLTGLHDLKEFINGKITLIKR